MTLESIRDYAAAHGRLPESLSKIENLPIPSNPCTDRRFGYSVNKTGDTTIAVLSAETKTDTEQPDDLRVELLTREQVGG